MRSSDTARTIWADAEELWRRIALTILITNVDDHMRNHGFLHVEKNQWRLSPAFDINPFLISRELLKHGSPNQQAMLPAFNHSWRLLPILALNLNVLAIFCLLLKEQLLVGGKSAKVLG
jgi:hypothetical protein